MGRLKCQYLICETKCFIRNSVPWEEIVRHWIKETWQKDTVLGEKHSYIMGILKRTESLLLTFVVQFGWLSRPLTFGKAAMKLLTMTRRARHTQFCFVCHANSVIYKYFSIQSANQSCSCFNQYLIHDVSVNQVDDWKSCDYRATLKKLVLEDLSFVTWSIILLEAAMTWWRHNGHKSIDVVSNNVQVGCCI